MPKYTATQRTTVHDYQERCQHLLLQGITIVPSRVLVPHLESAQFRFPKSKKVRIRKKWSKNFANYHMVSKEPGVVMGNTVYVSEATFDLLKENYHSNQSVSPDLMVARHLMGLLSYQPSNGSNLINPAQPDEIKVL